MTSAPFGRRLSIGTAWVHYVSVPVTRSGSQLWVWGDRNMSDERKFWMPSSVGRRQFIIGAGATAALAACGGDDSASNPTTAPSATGGGTEPTTAPGATTGATATTGPAVTPTTQPAGGIKPGGTLRVGVVGSTNDLMDGQYIVSRADQARLISGWEPIANYDNDFNIAYDNSLAEEIEAKAADNYVIRLKQGIEFHNGKTVGADDLIYSFNRLIDPDLGIAPNLAQFVDANSFTKLDDRTVEVTLLTPSVAFLYSMADYGATVVPVDYARFAGDPSTQIGTSAYKLESFTPGSESVHTRFENYWGESYLDEVQIIDFADQSALVNALGSGDIDVAVDLPYAQAGAIEANTDLALLESAAGNWQTITIARRHGTLRRRPGATGDASDRQPRRDGAARPVGPRSRR